MLLFLRKAWPFLAVLFIVVIAKVFIDNYNKAQQDLGKADVVITSQKEVINNAVQANEARAETNDPTKFVKYCRCLRSTRSASNCERYLPNDGADYSKSASLCKAP